MIELNDLITWFNLANMDKDKILPVDYKELIRLNHLVMEASHDIHNTNMLEGK